MVTTYTPLKEMVQEALNNLNQALYDQFEASCRSDKTCRTYFVRFADGGEFAPPNHELRYTEVGIDWDEAPVRSKVQLGLVGHYDNLTYILRILREIEGLAVSLTNKN